MGVAQGINNDTLVGDIKKRKRANMGWRAMAHRSRGVSPSRQYQAVPGHPNPVGGKCEEVR